LITQSGAGAGALVANLQQEWGNIRTVLLAETETGQRLRQSSPLLWSPRSGGTLDQLQSPSDRARYIRDQLPVGGLLAGLPWRLVPAAFPVLLEVVK